MFLYLGPPKTKRSISVKTKTKRQFEPKYIKCLFDIYVVTMYIVQYCTIV